MRELLVSRVVADIKENYDESYNYYVDHGCNEFADWLGVAHGSISKIIKELGWDDKEIRKFIVEERNDRRVTNRLTEDTGEKKVYEIRTINGNTLRCSGGHKIVVKRGRKQVVVLAKHLKLTDKVVEINA